MWGFLLLLCPAIALASFGPEQYQLSDAFLRNIMLKLKESEQPEYFDEFPSSLEEQDLLQRLSEAFPERVAKDSSPSDTDSLDYLNLPGSNPMIRDQEYLQHSSLWGHQYVAGGAGEGKQHLTPTGGVKNSPEVKTDAVLPAYCNPPNPCPKGYTAEQGCLEEFENSAEFSRKYQEAQDCMCDTEHMFECPTSSRDSQLSALARSMQNDGLSANTISEIMGNVDMTPHKSLVAKKFHVKKNFHEYENMQRKAQLDKSKAVNPYLEGEKLPIAAKKGINVM